MSESLPLHTIIEVVAISEKTGKAFKQEKTFKDWLTMEKKEGYIYTAFQKGKESFTCKK